MTTCIDLEDPAANVKRGCLVKIVDTIGTYGQPGHESLGYCTSCGAKVISYTDDEGREVVATFKYGEMRREVL